ncbi:hypothetical protein MNV49_005304 [Pseudohyphozyma bogoriensis]|nr:hypothetical protein MNV49_005304 [Pseudohyphozyma bogoriensis]
MAAIWSFPVFAAQSHTGSPPIRVVWSVLPTAHESLNARAQIKSGIVAEINCVHLARSNNGICRRQNASSDLLSRHARSALLPSHILTIAGPTDVYDRSLTLARHFFDNVLTRKPSLSLWRRREHYGEFWSRYPKGEVEEDNAVQFALQAIREMEMRIEQSGGEQAWVRSQGEEQVLRRAVGAVWTEWEGTRLASVGNAKSNVELVRGLAVLLKAGLTLWAALRRRDWSPKGTWRFGAACGGILLVMETLWVLRGRRKGTKGRASVNKLRFSK